MISVNAAYAATPAAPPALSAVNPAQAEASSAN